VRKDLQADSLDFDWPCLEKTFESDGSYYIRNGIDMGVNQQQWGREILAKAKAVLEEHIHRAQAAAFPAIYARTDGFITSADALPLFAEEIGDGLGQLKIEGQTTVGVKIDNYYKPEWLK
jgi:hypothetical protein